MKKILQVTTVSLSLGFITEHIKLLINEKNIIDIATNVIEPIKEGVVPDGVDIKQIEFQRNPFSLKNFYAYKKIKKIYRENKYDIVHVHTPVAAFLTRLALRKENGVKVIYTAHGFHFYKGANLLNWLLYYPLEKIAAKWTDIIITINQEDYDNANKFKLRNRGKVYKVNGVGVKEEDYKINNFNRNLYRKNLKLEEDDFVILVLAELNKNKNHIQLIKAMSLLKDKYPNIKAIFAGVGPLEEKIKKQIKENGLEGKISLLGWRNDVKELINLSDVVGLFSKREGLGKCLLEAMLCGKCVIATNTRGPRELIEQDINGFMFEIDDIESTAKSIEKIYIDNNLRNKFEEKVVDTANKYLLDNVLKQLSEVYENLYK